ncbi:MAG: AmmeMemoRadiSam system radical SAM enzyme [Candidatus Nitrosocaldaceae archaeon]|nr:MAG: AmmeMemoRadiSam system radical SAM enzyme [Candidatus Nitrosocaldaceae archaeon]
MFQFTKVPGKEAVLYHKEDGRVRCTACARYCSIPEGKIGLCGIRGNVNGKLYLFVYGRAITGHIDPIEKKPVIHYRPGSKVFSIATTGCNWLCKYCQNYDISQRRKIEGLLMSPEDIVKQTLGYGCQGIAYTYNEPTIFIEYARDIGVLAREHGLFNIFVSNGYATPDAVKMMNQFLDCITVDFKGNAEPNFMRKYIGVPNPDPIFDTLREIRDKTRIHIEITDLVVPKVGDDLEYAKRLAKFVYDELSPDIPLHFLRFHPDYKMMDLPNTPIETLEKHYEIAKSVGLKYVYLGNVPGHKYEHTYCPECNSIVIGRYGYYITEWNLNENNCCKNCSYPIPIIGGLEKTALDNRFQFVF